MLTLLQNGQTLYQTKLDHTAIADNYITLSIPVQKPKKNTRYELKISASDASKGDGILFGYRLSKTLGNYPGSLHLDAGNVFAGLPRAASTLYVDQQLSDVCRSLVQHDIADLLLLERGSFHGL